jgi:hypothetical protein
MMNESQMIYKQMSLVMSEINPVKKDQKNEKQNYFFRGIDAVYQAAQSALVKHKVFCIPCVLSSSREERTTKGGSLLIYTILRVKYTFFAEDGSFVDCVTEGEGMDMGDKSCNKAMSAAHKYALLQTFCVPTDEPKDSENDSPEPLPKTSTTKPKTVVHIKPKPLNPDNNAQRETIGKMILEMCGGNKDAAKEKLDWYTSFGDFTGYSSAKMISDAVIEKGILWKRVAHDYDEYDKKQKEEKATDNELPFE